MLGYAIIQLPEMTLSMYTFINVWTKQKSFKWFNNSNGEKVSLKDVHGFDTNARKIQLRNQKNDEIETKIDRGCQCIEHRKEMILMIESLKSETDLKLYNINESLKEISKTLLNRYLK